MGYVVQRKYERGNDTHAYLQRKNERDNAKQAYLQRRCVRTHGHTVTELRVWSGNAHGIHGNVSLSVEYVPALPSCKELVPKFIIDIS